MDETGLRIGLLGPLRIQRGRTLLPLPKSKKTLGLLAYLIVARGPKRRERLCEMFWESTDDPRASLRWSLSKLRVLDDEDALRIVSDRESVDFAAHAAHVDALSVRAEARGELSALSVERLASLAGSFRGGFLDELELPECHAYQAWRAAEREAFRELHARLLRAWQGRLSDSPEAALAPARELVRLSPQDEAARASLVRLLAATGRDEEAEEHFNLGRKQLDKSDAPALELRSAWQEARQRAGRTESERASAPPTPRQEVRFCTAPDGVRIAYASVGQGPPLLKTANWLSHLEFDWKSPLWRHLARELSREFQLVRYDQRGNGLSDRDVSDLSLDACLGDLEAVVGATGLSRFALFGMSQGCRTAIAYAVRHPERVTHLVLYGGSARGWKHRGAGSREMRQGLQGLIRHGWGQDNPAFRQVFTTLFMPGATTEQAQWFNELQRVSASPEMAYRITEASGQVDVSSLLAEVRVPTLVLHARADAFVAFDEGRRMAAAIEGARFVSLESQNHLLLDDEPAFARLLAEVRDFVTSEPPVRPPKQAR